MKPAYFPNRRKQRQVEAVQRNEAWQLLSKEQKLRILDYSRPGWSEKEHRRLLAQ